MKKNHALLSIFILVALVAITGWAQLFIKINHNADVYFSPDNETYLTDQKAREVFPQDDAFLFLFENENVFGMPFLKKLAKATEGIEQLDNVDRVISVTNLEDVRGTVDGFSVSPLVDPQRDRELSAQDIRQKVLNNRFAQDAIAGKSHDAVAIVIRPVSGSTTQDQVRIRSEALSVLEDHDIKQYLAAISGQSETMYAQLEAMLDSLQKYFPIAIIINIAFIIWVFPRPLAIVLSLVTVTISVQAPTALLNAFRQDFTMIHSMMPSIMTALSVALLVHFYNRLQHYSQLGYSVAERTYIARNDILKPAFFVTLTTMAGFIALSFSPIPPIKTFGLCSAFGVLVIFTTIIYILPPILARFDKPQPWKKGRRIDNFLDMSTRKIALWTLRRSGLLVVVGLAILICGLPLLSKVKVETDMFRFFADDHRVNVDMRKVEENISGITIVDLYIEHDEFDGVKSPEFLNEVVAFETWLNTLPQIDKTTSYATLVEDMHWAFHAEDEQYRTIPDNAALIEQYIFVYDGKDLFEFVNYDFNKAHITLNINVHKVGEIKKLKAQIETYLQQNPLPNATVDFAGFGSLYIDISELVTMTQLYSLSIAISVIFIFMILVFRSLKHGLLCMVPNLSPILIVFMTMGLFGIWLDVGTAMIASVGVGIAVDDTIHFYSAYLRRKKAGNSMAYSLMRAYQHEGRAIIITSIILATQFFIIGLSDFLPTRNFGLLSGLNIVTVLIYDLVVLPALIVVIYNFKQKRNAGDTQQGVNS